MNKIFLKYFFVEYLMSFKKISNFSLLTFLPIFFVQKNHFKKIGNFTLVTF
jgi:hypothetical protein